MWRGFGHYQISDNRKPLKERYFGDKNKISRKKIKDTFNSKEWKNDDIALFDFQLSFLMVIWFIFCILIWLRVILLVVIHGVLSCLRLHCICWRLLWMIRDGNQGKPKFEAYKMYAFPFTFLVWMYEAFPCLVGSYCDLVGDRFPQILKWSSTIESPSYELERNVFGNPKVNLLLFFFFFFQILKLL